MRKLFLKVLYVWLRLIVVERTVSRPDIKDHLEGGKIISLVVTLLTPFLSLITEYWHVYSLFTGWVTAALLGLLWEGYQKKTGRGTADWSDFRATSRGGMIMSFQLGGVIVAVYFIQNLINTL